MFSTLYACTETQIHINKWPTNVAFYLSLCNPLCCNSYLVEPILVQKGTYITMSNTLKQASYCFDIVTWKKVQRFWILLFVMKFLIFLCADILVFKSLFTFDSIFMCLCCLYFLLTSQDYVLHLLKIAKVQYMQNMPSSEDSKYRNSIVKSFTTIGLNMLSS